MAFMWGKKRKGQVAQLEKDFDDLAAAEDMVFDDWADNLAHRPKAEAPGVDISAVMAADPSFNDQDFLAIARDCFYHVRNARTADDLRFDDAILSPQLEGEVTTAIEGDVASHRHHLLPGLEIRSIVITSASVTDGKMTIIVQMHLSSEEEERDDSGALTGGSQQIHEWDESWTFWRDSTADPAATDKERTLASELTGGWMFAHKGWIVTSITRAGADAAAG